MHTSMISRIFGGVEGKAMASNPPWSATSAIFMRLPPRRPRTSSHHPLQLVLCRLDNSLHGETKFPLEVLQRCRGPEGPHADALAIRPDILRPAKNDACSTETRAETDRGKTLSWYTTSWSSNSSHEGILMTRDWMPCAVS